MKMTTNVVNEKQLREAQLRALELFANAVSCTYGPMGGYTVYSKQDPSNKLKGIVSYYTKDGFTVLKNVDTDKPIECLLKDDIRTICTQVIKTIGDGTTSATMLSYYIFKEMLETQQQYKISKRLMINAFKKIIKEGIDFIESNKRDCTLDDIYNIAYTSLNGNEEMAKTIHDIYKDSGMNVFIDVTQSNTKDTVVKSYKSMVYDAGFIDSCFINNEKDNTCELSNCHVYVFESPIDTPDMIMDLKMIFEKEVSEPIADYNRKMKLGQEIDFSLHPVVVICPKISRDANSYIDQLVNSFTNMTIEQKPRFCIVANIDNDNGYLLDIMKLTGAKFIKKYIDKESWENDKNEGLAVTEDNLLTFAGEAEKVVVDSISTKIINPKNMYDENGEYTEFYNNYIYQLEDLLKKYEETREELVKIGNLKRRINIIKANMVDLFVGGIGTTDRMALSDAVEDAVLNCRSAAVDGVGYGGNYEGLRAFNEILKGYNKNLDEARAKWANSEVPEELEALNKVFVDFAVANLIAGAYITLVTKIYIPYCDDNADKASSIVVASIANSDKEKRTPFNILTEDFDGKVLSSIKTEPAILDSISRIITMLFNTNQFLVPDPRFNIYEMSEENEVIHNISKEEAQKIEEEESETVAAVPVEQYLKS
nr:MAG TPA: Heat shock protein 60 [Caudoviricetes sp.]